MYRNRFGIKHRIYGACDGTGTDILHNAFIHKSIQCVWNMFYRIITISSNEWMRHDFSFSKRAGTVLPVAIICSLLSTTTQLLQFWYASKFCADWKINKKKSLSVRFVMRVMMVYRATLYRSIWNIAISKCFNRILNVFKWTNEMFHVLEKKKYWRNNHFRFNSTK